MTGKKIVTHRDLEVYRKAFAAAMEIFTLTKGFPRVEMYSLVDQMRRSSRSVCSNLAEAWRKRRYEGAFISKLNDAEGEAAETQVWIEFSVGAGHMAKEPGAKLYRVYNEILKTLVGMSNHPETWVLDGRRKGV